MLLLSCNPEGESITPLRDYAAQYATDIENIENFLKEYKIDVIQNPGASDDQNVTFTKIPANSSLVSIWNQTEFPLQTRLVELHGITYTIYYLKLREGNGSSPSNVDQVLTSYNGKYIFKTTATDTQPSELNLTQFEENLNPQSFFSLISVIRGWSEIFPQFKTGTYSENPDGTIAYQNFGAGVLFIPSGLGYFNSPTGTIPSYSPLIFSFKLYEIIRTDLDGDGILSYLEDIGSPANPTQPDGYLYTFATGVTNVDDTDGDGIPNFRDQDDDGDGFTTRFEITNTLTNTLFPFAEIPTCSDGKKRHLSNLCNN